MLLQRVREWLVLFLIAFLPFHAFLVTVGTRLLAGVGRAPMPALALWKEAILGLVLCIALAEALLLWRRNYQYTSILITPTDVLDWLIIGLLVLGVSVSATHYSLLTTHFFFGFKYTLFPLFLFLILRRVPWSERSFQLSLRPRAQGRVAAFSFQVTGTLVAVYGILTLFLPGQFFAWLGYSDLHSTYLPDGPLVAFQYIEGTGIRRMQATFAGPNQLGMWLLIPWSAVLYDLLRYFPSPLGGGLGRGGAMCRREGGYVLLLLLFAFALFLTFSRAAWIGAAAIMGVLLATRYSLLARWKFWSAWVIGLLVVCVIGGLLFPAFFLRTASSREHLRRPLQALQIIAQHPLGLGLGAAGPAANRTGDPCVYLEEGADPSWAADRPNLCVFVGDRQVQPIDRACRCPVLPENWYLQVGVELGVLGLVLYLALVGVIGYWLLVIGSASDSVFGLVFLGISVAALFLHAWEDSAVAYTVWMLIAAALPSFNHRLSSPSTIVC